MENTHYSRLDQEIVILAAAWELIGSMVNYGHFEKNDDVRDVMLRFKTVENGKLFSIVLADFLSYPTDGTLGLTRPQKDGSLGWTYLGYLDGIPASPSFSGDITLLNDSVRQFAKWLDDYIIVRNVWFPSIDYGKDLRVKRLSYLRICGTGSKHGFTRLGKVVKDIRQIMGDNGFPIDEGQGYLLIPEFIQWFRDDILIASATTIAWHLNEIRWGIFKYLKHEYHRTYRPLNMSGSLQSYEYDVPSEVSNQLIRSMYWDLMNEVRMPPYFPRFEVQPFLKKMY